MTQKESTKMTKEELLKMNLQHFAEEDNGGTEDEGGTEELKPEDDGAEETFTKEDIEKIVKERLDRATKKAVKEREDAVRKAKEEAERIANLTAEEREKERLEDIQRELNEYKEREKRSELRSDARKLLGAKGFNLSEDELDTIVKDDFENTEKAVNSFVKLVENQLQEKLKESARQKDPTNFNSGANTKENYGERLAKKYANPLPKGE